MKIAIGKIASAVAVATLVSGCATITRGTRQDYVMLSTPPGAVVTTTTGVECVTPCTLKLKRKHGFTATFTLPGYETQTAVVTSDVSSGGVAGLAGNVLIGGIIGAGVDASNGSLNSLSPDSLNITLTPVPASPAAAVVEPVAAAVATDAVEPEAAPVEPAPAVETVPETATTPGE